MEPAPEVGYFEGNDNREEALWRSGHILDHSFGKNGGVPSATWHDRDGQLCELTADIAADSHFIRSKSKDIDYGTVRYYFSRTEQDDAEKHLYVIASDRKRIEQRDKNGDTVHFWRRVGEAGLLKSILDSYADYDYAEILQPYNSDFNGLNERAAFNQIVHEHQQDKRLLRRIGQKLRSIVGN